MDRGRSNIQRKEDEMKTERDSGGGGEEMEKSQNRA